MSEIVFRRPKEIFNCLTVLNISKAALSKVSSCVREMSMLSTSTEGAEEFPPMSATNGFPAKRKTFKLRITRNTFMVMTRKRFSDKSNVLKFSSGTSDTLVSLQKFNKAEMR